MPIALGLLCLSCPSCGNQAATSVTATADAGPPPPYGFVSLVVTNQSGNPFCGTSQTTDWFTLGSATPGKPMTVQSGSTVGDANVTVQCTVHPHSAPSAGFDASVSINVQDASGVMNAFVSFDSFGGQLVYAGGTGISAHFTTPSGAIDASGCTLTFTYQGKRILDGSPIGPGHLWGHLSCSMPKTACDAEADFLVENCSQ